MTKHLTLFVWSFLLASAASHAAAQVAPAHVGRPPYINPGHGGAGHCRPPQRLDRCRHTQRCQSDGWHLGYNPYVMEQDEDARETRAAAAYGQQAYCRAEAGTFYRPVRYQQKEVREKDNNQISQQIQRLQSLQQQNEANP